MRRTWLALAACLALVLAGGGTAAASVAAPAGDGPPGFWWGSDSWPIPVTGSAPYSMPRLGGAYGGYIGMTGNWAYWLCSGGAEHFLAYSTTNAAQAHTNFVTYHKGVGVGAYWFMGGPGVDPNWNGTAAEAYKWGARQAARALADIGGGIDYPVVWMDIELPGIGPATDNGWNSVYTSPCSGTVRQQHILASIDRADFNGFFDYITAHSKYKPGVYSSVPVWNSVFGSNSASPGSPGYIPHTAEWTYEPETASLSSAPYGWCLNHGSGACAQFFGGVSSSSGNALMWQWSGGGGVRNGVGDFDQIDGARHP
jgi:hypothetical protein